MSANSLALTTSGSWRSGGNDYGTSSPEHDRHWNRRSAGVPRPLYLRLDEDRGMYAPWRLFEERVRTGPFGLTRFPLRPYSPVRVLVINGDVDESVNPRLRQFIEESPPRIRAEWHLGPASSEPEDPSLSDEEFKKAMKNIRKHVYNPPPYPRRRAWKRGLFSRRSSSNVANEEREDEKEEEKQCTVCLETFAANEQVLMTPCNHMFHNDCLVPWVKSHGKCPVCRHVFCERKETALSRSSNGYNNNNGNGNGNNHGGYGNGNNQEGYSNVRHAGGDGDFAADLASLLRAMDEAFNWIHYSRR